MRGSQAHSSPFLKSMKFQQKKKKEKYKRKNISNESNVVERETKKSLYEKNTRRYEDTYTPYAHRQRASSISSYLSLRGKRNRRREGGGRGYESLRGNKILTKTPSLRTPFSSYYPGFRFTSPSPSPLLAEELRQAARKGGFLANC